MPAYKNFEKLAFLDENYLKLVPTKVVGPRTAKFLLVNKNFECPKCTSINSLIIS